MNGFPYALLYTNAKYGRVGLKNSSDIFTLDNLRNLEACLPSDHFTASASNGHLSRSVGMQ